MHTVQKNIPGTGKSGRDKMAPIELFFAILPSLIVSVVMAMFNHRTNKRDKYADELSATKIESDRLQLNLTIATAKLSYALAMAIKRGAPNGEIEEGMSEYKKCMEQFQEFERMQVSKLNVKR